MKDFFRINVDIQKDENKSAISKTFYNGTISISVNETVKIQQIVGQLSLKMKGRMSTYERSLDKFFISNSIKKFVKGETYQFPFDFEYTSDMPTFKGRNFSSLYELKFEFDFDKENYEKLNGGVLSSISTFFSGERKFKYIEYINLEQSQKAFQIVESDGKLYAESKFFLFFILTVLLAIIYFGIFFQQILNQDFGIIMLEIILCIGIAVALQYLILTTMIGHFKAQLVIQNRDNFLSIFYSEKNWNYISKATTTYSIVEKVVDDRGTSSTTSTATLYLSPKKEISKHNQEEEVLFAYPTNQVLLPTLQLGDVSIKWMLHLTLTPILGFKLDFTKEFIVKSVD